MTELTDTSTRQGRRLEYFTLGWNVIEAGIADVPVLARAKRMVVKGLGSAAMTADSRQTDLCAYLSAILLAGLGLNALFGWWWADPVAALAMLPLVLHEAREAIEEAREAEPSRSDT